MPRTLSEQEYDAVRDAVMQSAPPNLDEATFTRWIGPQMAAAIHEAELRQPEQEGSGVGRFARNLGAMINPVTIAQGAYNAVRHPVDTGTAIVQQMGGEWDKAGDSFREGRYSEAGGHALAGSIPLIGPTAAAIGEQAAGGDYAGAAGAATGLLAPTMVRPAINAVRNVTPGDLRATVAERLENKAASNISRSISPMVGPNKTRFGNMAEQVAPELAKRPELAAWSRTGFEANVTQAFDAATAKLDDAANARLSARTFDTQPMIDALKQSRSRWVSTPVEASKFPKVGDVAEPLGKAVIPPENAARVARIDQTIADLEQLGPSARYESIRRLREGADKSAKIKYNPSMTQDFLKVDGTASGAADVAGVLRDSLAKFDPATAAANTEYALFRKASDVLDAIAEVERTRPKVGRQLIARWAGAGAGSQAAGLKGAVVGYVLGPVVESITSLAPTTKFQTAKLMSQMAEALRKGDTGRALSLADQIKKAAKSTAGLAARSTASGYPTGTPATSSP